MCIYVKGGQGGVIASINKLINFLRLVDITTLSVKRNLSFLQGDAHLNPRYQN